VSRRRVSHDSSTKNSLVNDAAAHNDLAHDGHGLLTRLHNYVTPALDCVVLYRAVASRGQ
jgi:hypothetical protein